jgi:hypothetical protein
MSKESEQVKKDLEESFKITKELGFHGFEDFSSMSFEFKRMLIDVSNLIGKERRDTIIENIEIAPELPRKINEGDSDIKATATEVLVKGYK